MNQTAGQTDGHTDGDTGRTMTDEQSTQAGVDRRALRNYERLQRSLTDRKVAGVAGGLGRHLNIDPTILRVVLVVLCFFGGAGFLLYGAAWLLVPEEGAADGKIATSPATRNVLLIAAGAVAVLILLGNSWGGIGFPWPVTVVGVGVVIYLLLRDRPVAAAGTGVAPHGAGPGGPAGSAPPTWSTPPPPAPRPRRRGPLLFGFTLAVVAVALGVLGLYDATGGAVVDTAYPALALAVVGVMLVVGAFVGRAGGLILLGLVAAAALALTSLVGGFRGLDFHDGQRFHIAPTSASGVRSTYDLSSGRAVIDLRDVRDPQALAGRTIDVNGYAGELLVILPDDVSTDVTAEISGPGAIDLPGRNAGGIGAELDGTYDNAARGTDSGTLTLHTRLSAGHIDVRNP